MRLLLLVLLLLLSAAPAAWADDPFGKPPDTAPAPAAAPPAAAGPSLFGGYVQRLARTQARLNDRISSEIRTVRDTGSAAALATILSIAFLWGVLHAAGPGHGKSLVAAYLVSSDASWTSGIVMGGAMSLLQGLTAIVAVLVLAVILHELQTKVQMQGALIELISYGLVALLGLVMLWRAATGKAHGHHHGPLPAEHHDHDHDHAHNHGHDHHHAPADRRPGFRAILTLFGGLAPCASAIIIMLFSLANDALLIGAVAVLALSLGMGLTVSAIGILSVVARDFMRRLARGSPERGERIERLLALAGSLAVVGFSTLLMLGAWDRLSSPI